MELPTDPPAIEPPGNAVYVNVDGQSKTLRVKVTRNGQPAQGVNVHWTLTDPDEPDAPSYLDGTPCNCGINCPDEGQNQKVSCNCTNETCPAAPDNLPNDNHGTGAGLSANVTQTNAQGIAEVTLTTSTYGGDNYIVTGAVCPTTEHPEGVASVTFPVFTVWRKIYMEHDAMEAQDGTDWAFETTHDNLPAAFSAGYIAIVLAVPCSRCAQACPDWGDPACQCGGGGCNAHPQMGGDRDQGNCEYRETMTKIEAIPYAANYFNNPPHTDHLQGIREFEGMEAGVASGQHAVVANRGINPYSEDEERHFAIHEVGHVHGVGHEVCNCGQTCPLNDPCRCHLVNCPGPDPYTPDCTCGRLECTNNCPGLMGLGGCACSNTGCATWNPPGVQHSDMCAMHYWVGDIMYFCADCLKKFRDNPNNQ